ncbi:TlpA family protein disulfide reductase [Acidobacteria bacterium AH-259-L09]|nr:TlpA family protein disulfide reductase [Acidobacteria bacterium AH-259-L09]
MRRLPCFAVLMGTVLLNSALRPAQQDTPSSEKRQHPYWTWIKEVKALPTSDDLKPILLPTSRGHAGKADLSLQREIILKVDASRPITSIHSVAVLPSAICLSDPRSSLVRMFDQKGTLLGYLADDLIKRREMQRLEDIHFGVETQRIYIADGGSVFVFDPEDGRLEKRIRQRAYSVVELSAGRLAVSLLAIQGPHAAMMVGEEYVRTFCSERRNLLGPEEEFRPNFPPRFHLERDGEGNIYAVGHVDYEIRKYDQQGNYIGDFQVQPDPEYIPPPERVDKERWWTDRDLTEQWMKSWSRVESVVVVQDRYLVVCLTSREGYRLHFYTLDGSVPFSPIPWDYRLLGDDEEGNLYFADDKDRLLLFSLGAHAPEPTRELTSLNLPGPSTGRRTSDSKTPISPKDDRSAESVAAPAFAATSLAGDEFTLSTLRGKVVVLNFWFIDCPPCRVEIPVLNKLVDQFEGKEVVFLAFARDDADRLRSFLRQTEFKYEVIPNSAEVVKNFSVKTFPTHIVIDQEGNIEFVSYGGGAHVHEVLTPPIKRLLDGKLGP